MQPTYYQEKLFAAITERCGDASQLSTRIADELKISRGAAYRRIRGDTHLSLDEAMRLADVFGLALHELSDGQTQTAVFNKGPFIQSLDEYQRYLENSLQQLELIAQMPGHQLIYQAKDIPIYYQFGFPKMGAFKIFVWLYSVYGIREVEGAPLTLDNIPASMLELARRQGRVFAQINSVEIWNDTTVLSMIKQLEYFFEAGLLPSREVALTIIDEFEEMMRLIGRQVEEGYKGQPHHTESFTQATYRMYYHEILIMDNHILALLPPEKQFYFIPYAGVNYLTTTDATLTRNLQGYLDQQCQKSSLINEVSEKERNRFFGTIRQRLERLRHQFQHSDPLG
ncbi:MAG: hypothetical protein RI842_09400 [Schleiferiaceae bacterium]|nr:hypothetical protein [Schleiferiaceae bacterium]MDR9442923.1 hypothetical protein [Schleiferiaceae bacterium]